MKLRVAFQGDGHLCETIYSHVKLHIGLESSRTQTYLEPYINIQGHTGLYQATKSG